MKKVPNLCSLPGPESIGTQARCSVTVYRRADPWKRVVGFSASRLEGQLSNRFGVTSFTIRKFCPHCSQVFRLISTLSNSVAAPTPVSFLQYGHIHVNMGCSATALFRRRASPSPTALSAPPRSASYPPLRSFASAWLSSASPIALSAPG